MTALLTRSQSPVSVSFSALGCSQKEAVGTSGCLECQLIEGEDLTTGSKDSLAGSFGDSECADGELRHNEESFVVGDGGSGDNDLVALSFRNVLHNAGK